MFLWLKTLYRKRAVTWPFIFYTIIWTLSFSNSYLKDLNKLRGKIGLPKYREDYRITFGLYPNKINETLRIYGIGFLLAVLYLIFLK